MRTNDLFPFTGYTEDEKFSIYGDNFSFTFMENKQTTINSNSVEIEDDLIRGFSHAGKQVAIACENELSVSGYRRLNTYCIYKAINHYKEKISEFNKITFSGGMLNTLFRRDSLEIDTSLEVKVQNDLVTYDYICNGEHETMNIWSSVSWSSGWRDGTRLDNSNVMLSISFEKKKPLSYAIKCYQYVCDCIRFMMNRYNVGFDEITIATIDSKDDYDQNRFNVFFREDYNYTEKEGFRCITFDDLGESFTKLYLLFATSTNSKMNYSFGFFPQDDRSVNLITNSIIRSICAALEFEAEKEPTVQANNNTEMKELIKSVKDHIKVFRKAHEGISESTYSNIFTSLGFWSFSARDKIEALWNVHKKAMEALTRRIVRDETIDIGEFVKHRNKITHGAETQVTNKAAYAAYVLRGLVYCCVLKRIGIREEDIIGLCKTQINE